MDLVIVDPGEHISKPSLRINIIGKRPAIRAFQIRLTHEIVCPLIGKLSGTHDERYGAFRS